VERRKIGEQDLDRLFFTADLHLGHARVFLPEYCNRPWQDLDIMDEQLINRWNRKVPEKGIVVVVGDLVMDVRKLKHYVPKLNGRILYVLGDHGDCKPGDKYSELFDGVFHLLRLSLPGDRPDIVCCHWAMRKWPKAHWGAWHLFGHSHGEVGPHGLSFDVGVDAPETDYMPLSYYEVAMMMAGIEASPDYEPIEHHGRRKE
jgi:calcineurin-like phosphoesterase family protein